MRYLWDDGSVTADAFRVFRAAKLTSNATPEPVRAGRSLVVTGKLTRANWQTCGCIVRWATVAAKNRTRTAVITAS